MTYNVDFLDEVQDDLIDSFRYYEKQTIGLGDDFLRTVDATINHITRHPLHYPEDFFGDKKGQYKALSFWCILCHRSRQNSYYRRYPSV